MKLSKVTFYAGCKINPNYFDTYRTQDLLDSYLTTLETKIEMTSPMFYLEFNGVITISLTGMKLTEGYNYMKAEYDDGQKLYYFITRWELSNGVLAVTYNLDVWHTFIEKVNMKFGHRILRSYKSSYPTSENPFPYEYIAKPLVNGAAQYKQIDRYSEWIEKDGAYLLVQGYAYYGVKPASGETSSVRPWLGILVGMNDDTPVAVPLPWGEQYLGTVYQEVYAWSSSGSGTKWYYEITGSWYIPKSFFSTDLVMNGYTGMEISNQARYVTIDDYRLRLCVPNTASTETVNSEIECTFNYMNDNDTAVNVLVGTKSNMLPVEPLVGRQHVTIAIGIGGFAPYIKMIYGSNQIDITDEFQVEINFTPESALVAQQRKVEFTNQIISAVGGALSAGAGMAMQTGQQQVMNAGVQQNQQMNAQQAINHVNTVSASPSSTVFQEKVARDNAAKMNALAGNTTNAGRGARNLGYGLEGGSIMASIAGLIASASERYSTVQSNGASSSIFSAYLGLYTVQMSAQNMDNVHWMYENFGIITDEYVNSFDFDTSIDFDLQCYEEVYLEGSIPEQYINSLQEILKGGTRVWNK